MQFAEGYLASLYPIFYLVYSVWILAMVRNPLPWSLRHHNKNVIPIWYLYFLIPKQSEESFQIPSRDQSMEVASRMFFKVDTLLAFVLN